MTSNPQTEARALLDGMRKHTAFLNDQEQDAIVDAIATALAAKDAELAGYVTIVAEMASSVALPETIKATGSVSDMITHFKELRARAERAEAQLTEANKALEPFAKEADQWEGYEDAEGLVEGWRNGPASSITVGHLRAARRAREAQGGENNG